MSDAPPYPPPRRRRLWALLLVLLVTFLAGVAVSAVLAARWGWFTPAPPRVVAVPGRPVAPAPLSAPVTPPADPATLATREAILSAQLASLESRTAIVSADADEAGARANRAEAMLVAFAARRAIDAGAGLGGLEAPLLARFGTAQPRAVDLVRRAARERLTPEELRAGLDALSPALLSGGGGWWSSLRHGLSALVVVHRAGLPSALPADRLARARRLLDTGQVEAAMAEVAQLPGGAGASNWLAAARRWVEVHRALDTLEEAAMAGDPAPGDTAVTR